MVAPNSRVGYHCMYKHGIASIKFANKYNLSRQTARAVARALAHTLGFRFSKFSDREVQLITEEESEICICKVAPHYCMAAKRKNEENHRVYNHLRT